MKIWLAVLAALILIVLAWDNRGTLALYTIPFFLNSEAPDFAAAEPNPAVPKLSYKTYENFDAMKDNSRQQIMDNNKLDIPRDKILEYELFNKRFQNILLDNKDLFYQINQK